MIYLDTSALLKLVKAEAESDALAAFIGDRTDFLSSKLLAVEARRGAMREHPSQLVRIDIFLSRVDMIGMTDAIVESASRLPDRHLRSLDAIHLATALLAREELDVMITYDHRLLTAAKAHDLPTAAPA